jgi:hypothetical protein
MAIFCSCNQIRGQDVEDYLLTQSGKKTTLNKLYAGASGNKKRDCTLCLDTFRTKVREHNQKVDEDKASLITVEKAPAPLI